MCIGEVMMAGGIVCVGVECNGQSVAAGRVLSGPPGMNVLEI